MMKKMIMASGRWRKIVPWCVEDGVDGDGGLWQIVAVASCGVVDRRRRRPTGDERWRLELKLFVCPCPVWIFP